MGVGCVGRQNVQTLNHLIESNVTKTFQAGVINISRVTSPIKIFSAQKIQNSSAVF